MAINSGQIVQSLIAGGVEPAAARAIANALANANTPQLSQSRDSSDQTPVEQLRIVTSDTRKYQLTNLDYSQEQPLQSAMESHPGRYVPGDSDHPYKDSQPVLPAPPLASPRIVGGPYIDVSDTTSDGAQQTTVGLKFSKLTGKLVRISPATNSLEAVNLGISAPQGLVTAEVSDSSSEITLQLQVRGISSKTLLLGDGTTTSAWVWDNPAATASQQMVTPAGAVLPFAGSLPASMSSAWLQCNGASYLTASYPNLFAVIGYTYGGSGGAFNVPDLRGYFVRGSGTNSDGTASGALGAKQADEFKSHTHTMFDQSGSGGQNGNLARYVAVTIALNQTFAKGTDAAGGAETRPKNIAMLYYIKT